MVEPNLTDVLKKGAKEAIGGGLPGMAAMFAQVSSLMWLRTTINYQYRYGTTAREAFKKLYQEGGFRRFYRGYSAAIVQGPLSRFGDTAANNGILTILDSYSYTQTLPMMVKTGFASAGAGGFRILLMPIDTIKTMMQVEGGNGMITLKQKIQESGPKVLFHGALASSLATIVGHYPWFATYNILNQKMENYKDKKMQLMRNAFIGFTASMISDTCSNSIRVIKTTRQTLGKEMDYMNIVKMIVDKDGWGGLFGRGLKTKIIANGFQGMLFSVYWKMGQDYFKNKKTS